MMVRVLLAVALMVGPTGLAQAEEARQAVSQHPIDVWLQAAIEKDSSTAGMRDATNSAREMWDKEMNASYARLMRSLSPDQQQALRASQRNWLAFRDSEAEVISRLVAAREGTMFQLMATGLGMDIVKSRANELRSYEAAIGDP